MKELILVFAVLGIACIVMAIKAFITAPRCPNGGFHVLDEVDFESEWAGSCYVRISTKYKCRKCDKIIII